MPPPWSRGSPFSFLKTALVPAGSLSVAAVLVGGVIYGAPGRAWLEPRPEQGPLRHHSEPHDLGHTLSLSFLIRALGIK